MRAARGGFQVVASLTCVTACFFKLFLIESSCLSR